MRETATSGVMRFLREHRALVPLVASVSYVTAAAVRDDDGPPLRPLLFGIAGVALVIALRRRPGRVRIAGLGLRARARDPRRRCTRGLDAFGAFGAAVGVVNAARAVVAMHGAGGLGAGRLRNRAS